MDRPIERHLLLRAALGAIAVPLLAAALVLQPARAATLSDQDAAYLSGAIRAQLGLYAEARLAAEKARDARVKRLGQQIERQALDANDALTRMARAAHIDVPTTPPLRESSHYGDLTAATGSDFDRTFLREVAIDLGIDADSAQDEQQHGNDPALKRFAAAQSRSLNGALASVRRLAR
jgi:putative membrane protein